MGSDQSDFAVRKFFGQQFLDGLQALPAGLCGGFIDTVISFARQPIDNIRNLAPSD